jgi:CubicO group peptidase (beta-lactamase class C family)
MKNFNWLLIAVFFYPAGVASGQEKSVFPTAKPESVGLSTTAVQAIADEVAGYAKADIIVGGELLIVKNRKTVLHEVYGYRDREDKRPMERNTIFNVRSMTKSLTGVAVQILVDEGMLRLDDPVAKYLPAFDNDKSRAITIEHLLTHRSGLPLTIISTKIDQFPDLQTQAKAIGEKGPQFKPGEKFWYSDAGSDCAAAVVEKLAGMTIDRFVTERILKPIRMADSFYPTKADDPRQSRIASLYFGSPYNWNRLWKAGGQPMYPFAWGSQTLYSTPTDYARFLSMWLDGGKVADKQILSSEALKRILTPTSPMSMLGSDAAFPTGFGGIKAFYGQMSVLHATGDKPGNAKVIAFGHSGSDGTVAWAFPASDLIVCYFTQSRGQMTTIRLESVLDRELINGGKPRAMAPEALKPYLGTYYANFGYYKNTPFKVVFQNGNLALDIPDQLVFELTDPDKDGRRAFVISDKISIGFVKDSEGKVVSMNLKQAGFSFDLPIKPVKLEVLKKEAVEKYLGKYRREEDDVIVEVIFKDGIVKTSIPTTGMEVELTPSADMKSWGVRAVPGNVVTFQEGKDGAVVSFTVEVPGGKKFIRKRLEK